MPIEQVRKAYEAAIGEMKERFAEKDPSKVELAINTSRQGLPPFSLDLAWQQHLQGSRAQFETDMSLMDSRDALVKAVDRIGKQDLGDALNKWLVEADPFKGVQDQDALADRGEALLAVIKKCFDLAAAGGQPAEGIQADLVAIADAVRQRLSGFEKGVHGDLVDEQGKALDAGRVPRQMYVELTSTIEKSNTDALQWVKDAMSKTYPGRGAGRFMMVWEQGRDEKIQEITKNPKAPAFPWDLARESALKALGDNTTPARDKVAKLLESRDLKGQINNLYKLIEGDQDRKGFVMMFREAAWAVQDTLGIYRRGIDTLWESKVDVTRNDLDQHLFAVSDWLKKRVNLVMAEVVARNRGN